MHFHPKKCKVLSVSNKASENSMWSMFPFQSFVYTLNGVELDFTESEKDLGVIVTTDLNWEENIIALCSKASSRWDL